MMRDPVELEIVKNALTSIAEEMATVALKSAFSIILKESGDASSAICDRYGRLVAQTASATLYHLASFRPSLRELIADFPLETMQPGDVFVFNDQFRGGIHANDILVFTPVFSAGDVLFFTCDLMHVADLGGVSAGGLPSNATEFYHEGLRLPPLRLYTAGQPNHDLIAIIQANSRTPDKVMGDIRAMVAGNHVGARRLGELTEKYGRARILELCTELIDYTEVITRQEIAKIPSGVYEGSYVIEEDGVVPDHTYRVKVKVTINGSDCHLDFTGTDPQARGPINAATSQTMSGVMFALRCFMDPSIPINEGCFPAPDRHAPRGDASQSTAAGGLQRPSGHRAGGDRFDPSGAGHGVCGKSGGPAWRRACLHHVRPRRRNRPRLGLYRCPYRIGRWTQQERRSRRATLSAVWRGRMGNKLGGV